MHPFVAASTWSQAQQDPVDPPQPSSPATFATRIEPPWFQGKGAYGGLLCAGIVRAMMSVVNNPRRRPRTLHVHFCAPAKAGALALDVVVERAGTGISTLSARATQNGAAVCVASATFAEPRPRTDDNLRYVKLTMPDAPRCDDAPVAPKDIPLLPAFTQFFDYRFCLGDAPYSSSTRPLIGGWLRFHEPLVVDAPALAALVDAYPPALLPMLSEPRGASSVDLTMEFLVDTPHASLLPEQHVLVVQTSRVGDGGITDERCELWCEDGTLLATGRQLVALL